MLTVDDLVKFVLIFSVSFAIVGISVQLIKLIGKLVDVLEDTRHTLRNVNDLSSYALEDYVEARSAVRQALSGLTLLSSLFSNPANLFSKAKSTFTKMKEKESGEVN